MKWNKFFFSEIVKLFCNQLLQNLKNKPITTYDLYKATKYQIAGTTSKWTLNVDR